MAGEVGLVVGRLPLAGLEPLRVGERVDGRVGAGRLWDRGREIGVGLEDLHPVAGFSWRAEHYWKPPPAKGTPAAPIRGRPTVMEVTIGLRDRLYEGSGS